MLRFQHKPGSFYAIVQSEADPVNAMEREEKENGFSDKNETYLCSAGTGGRHAYPGGQALAEGHQKRGRRS